MKSLSTNEIAQVIFESLGALNEERPPEKHIPISEQTVLMGAGTYLDSLGFIVFLTNVEERMSQATGEQLEDIFDLDQFGTDSPFKNVATLTAYLETLLRERAG
jgi:acyl carrier protein